MERTDSTQELLVVSEVSRRLKVKPSWVYSHADDLGALRLGKYLRFSWPRVLERLTQASQLGPSSGMQPNDRF
jgi:hypothetical protein